MADQFVGKTYQKVNIDQEQKNQAYMVFGSDSEDDEEQEMIDEEQPQEEIELLAEKPSMIDQMQELKQSILKSEVPENLFLQRSKNNEDPVRSASDEELEEEATWVWRNLFAKNYPNSEVISRKIL